MPDISKITTPDGTSWDVKDLKARGVELTQAEYDALPSSKLTDGVDYYITDAQAGAPLATEIAMSTSDNTSVKANIDSVKESIDNFKEYSLATVPTTSYVSSGEIKCYKRGACLMIKLSGVIFTTFTGRVTIGALPTDYRPITQSTSHADGSTILFGVNTDGGIWIDSGASGRQLWGTLTCINI